MDSSTNISSAADAKQWVTGVGVPVKRPWEVTAWSFEARASLTKEILECSKGQNHGILIKKTA